MVYIHYVRCCFYKWKKLRMSKSTFSSRNEVKSLRETLTSYASEQFWCQTSLKRNLSLPIFGFQLWTPFMQKSNALVRIMLPQTFFQKKNLQPNTVKFWTIRQLLSWNVSFVILSVALVQSRTPNVCFDNILSTP